MLYTYFFVDRNGYVVWEYSMLFAFLGTVRILSSNFAQIWYSCILIDLSLDTSVNFSKRFKRPEENTKLLCSFI